MANGPVTCRLATRVAIRMSSLAFRGVRSLSAAFTRSLPSLSPRACSGATPSMPKPFRTAFNALPRTFSSLPSPPKQFSFLSPSALEEWLERVGTGASLGKDFLVIDVRDPDQFGSYHVRHAINLPSTVLLNVEDARDAVELVRLEAFRVLNASQRGAASGEAATDGAEGKPADEKWPIPLPRNVVFHCNLSLIRGPKSATRFIDGLNDMHYRSSGEDSDGILEDDMGVKVWVLEGGSKGWKGKYPGEPWTVVPE
ncbi:hypothetical protein DFJ74DRAFT_667717 [Hyaloraphidium curvatum]|nr:hypothetical protein DFJ74DRAFT_667717 [Hyaloraphidium curvatum]